MEDLGRRWWLVTLGVGLLIAVPILLADYLPMLDVPVHVTAFRAWLEDQPDYEVAPHGLPYWGIFFAARVLSLVLDPLPAFFLVIGAYCVALPLSIGFVLRALEKNGLWALLSFCFVYDFNLAMGFVAYCWATVGLLCALAFAISHERESHKSQLLGLLLVSVATGITHPQIGLMTPMVVVFLQLFSRQRPKARFAPVLASAPAALPTLLWFSSGQRQATAFGGAPEFLSFTEALSRFDSYSVNTSPGYSEEVLALVAFVLLLAAKALSKQSIEHEGGLRLVRWLAAPANRLLVLVVVFLLAYFVLPFRWNGQSISTRFPYLALCLLIPATAPRDFVSRRYALVVAALGFVSALLVSITISMFDLDTSEQFDPIVEAIPDQPRVYYFGYHIASDRVSVPVFLHAGAWLTAHRGGVYAFNFDRLIVQHAASVPEKQRLSNGGFTASLRAANGQFLRARREKLDFWNVYLARWHPGSRPVASIVADHAGEPLLSAGEAPVTLQIF